jgi:hypothetical protein
MIAAKDNFDVFVLTNIQEKLVQFTSGLPK